MIWGFIMEMVYNGKYVGWFIYVYNGELNHVKPPFCGWVPPNFSHRIGAQICVLTTAVGDARRADGGQRRSRHERLAALWLATAGLSNAAQVARLIGLIFIYGDYMGLYGYIPVCVCIYIYILDMYGKIGSWLMYRGFTSKYRDIMGLWWG